MKQRLTDADLLKLLQKAIAAAGSLRKWAQAHGFSPTYLSLVLRGKSKVSTRLAASLGYRRVSFWEKSSG